MSARYWIATVSVAFALHSARARADEVVGTASQPIVEGRLSDAAPSVVGLTSTLGSLACTGTLVSPRVVVTAAHCLSTWCDLAFFGADPTQAGVFVPVVHSEAHEQLDVGLVQLARPAPIPPTPVRSAPLGDEDIGRSITFVGFGVSVTGDIGSLGKKRVGEAPLEAFDEWNLSYSGVTCHGDSGGPALLDGELIGVTARGGPTCAEAAFSVRADVVASWLEAAIVRLDPAACNLDQRCVSSCPEPDPDCLLGEAGPTRDATAALSSSSSCGTSPGIPSGGVGIALAALAALLSRRSWRRGRGPALALAVSLTACSGESGEASPRPHELCSERFIGEHAEAPRIEIAQRPSAQGIALELLVANMDGCAVAVRARVLDSDGERTLADAGVFLEVPELDTLPPRKAAWTTTTEIAVDLPARYEVFVVAEDALGRSATATSRGFAR